MGGSSENQRWRLLAIVAVLAISAPEADADNGTPSVVVFESYEGPRPVHGAVRPIETLLRGLESDGWAALPGTIVRVVGDRLPRRGRTDPAMTVAKIRGKFSTAVRHTTGKGFDFKRAIALYEEGFRWVRENPAVVVADFDARNWLTDAYVGYATALLGDKRLDDAKRALRTQAISFWDTPITADRYGPEAAAPYQIVRREIEASPHGSLLVTVVDRVDAYVSINHVGRGRGSSFEANVVAGDYEVLVQVEGTALRYTFRADPAINQHAELRVHWDVDARLVVGEQWIGIERAPTDVVPALVHALPGYSVVTVSIVERHDRRWLVATRYAAGTGRQVEPCVAEIGTQAETAIRPCILGGARVFKDVYTAIPSRPGSRDASSEASLPARWPMWIAFGSSVAAIGAGAVFATMHEECLTIDLSAPDACGKRRDTLLPAVVSFGIGAASFAFMSYAYVRYANAVERQHSRPALGLGVGPGGAMVTLSGAFE